MKQTSDESKEKYQLGDYHMIQHQTFRISKKNYKECMVKSFNQDIGSESTNIIVRRSYVFTTCGS